jgi:hypothetical protein
MADSENPNLTNPIELMALLDIEFEERTPTRVTGQGRTQQLWQVEP